MIAFIAILGIIIPLILALLITLSRSKLEERAHAPESWCKAPPDDDQTI